MSTYLLLRDNKESGPYSFDELKNKGLKAYDLVWIEGRSAAWRYPSEVDELKSFAPAVEEQPFDRFFKKAPQQEPSLVAQNNASVAAQTRPLAEKELSFSAAMNSPLISTEPSSVPGKRIIYVTLPSDQRNGGMRVPTTYREPSRIQNSAPLPESRTQQGQGNEREPARTELSTLYVPAAGPVEDKFAQDNDDLWRSSVELTPRQQGLGLKKIIQPVMAIMTILALLAAGIFIGLSIKSDSFGFSQKADGKANPVAETPVAVQQNRVLQVPPPAVTPVVATNSPASGATNNTAITTIGNTPSEPGTSVPVPADQTLAGSATAQTATAMTPPPPAAQKKKSRLKGSPVNPKLSALPLSTRDSAALNVPVLHREAVHRSDENDGLDKNSIRSNIANMIAVGAGKYSVGTFGGISEVPVTVSNHSMYPIDLVVVEVQYVQANKKVFKTENLYFRNLGPGAAMMEEAPKSSRGVKIQYKVTLVNSKELGLSLSGI